MAAGSSPPSNTPGRHPGHPPRRARCRDRNRGRVEPEGNPEGYQLRGHHWPERWVLGGQDQPRVPELFVAGELLAAGGRAVVEVMLHEAAHALATKRGIKDTSAAGNRYHNKRFVAPAAELGLRSPDVPDKITGWSHCTLHGQAAYDAWAEVTAAIDAARLPFLVDPGPPGPPRRRRRPGPGRRRPRANPPSGAAGGRRSSVHATRSRAASNSRPSRSKTARSSAACAAPCSSYRKTIRTRDENAETDLDTARAQLAHPGTPGQTATGTAPRSRRKTTPLS